MASPSGTKRARWNQMVGDVARDCGWTTGQTDSLLNGIWASGFREGDIPEHATVARWLEVDMPDAGTAMSAFIGRVT